MDIPATLQHLYPDASWSLNGDSYDGLVWHDDSPMPSEDELTAAWPEVRDARAWAEVRAERDRLLAASDWAALKAVDAAADGLGVQVPQVWVDYRQALRDVPQDFATPDAVVWPEVP